MAPAQEQAKTDTSFLRFNTLLGGKGGSLASTVEEIVQLCKSMSIADAVHDTKIVENVLNLQKRSIDILESLSGHIEGLDHSPAESAEAGLSLCTELLAEIQKDVLQVATETCAKSSGFTTKSTVPAHSLTVHLSFAQPLLISSS
jgi:hypothetical protein